MWFIHGMWFILKTKSKEGKEEKNKQKTIKKALES